MYWTVLESTEKRRCLAEGESRQGSSSGMEFTEGNVSDILNALSNGSWPKAERDVGHGIWWNGDLRVSKLEQAILAVLYATVPLSYPQFYTIVYDARVLAECISSITDDAEPLEDPTMKSALYRLRDGLSSMSLAYHRPGRYVFESVGLGRRALAVDDFSWLFVSDQYRVRYKGESETQLQVDTVLPETYAGYSLKALGTYDFFLLRDVIEQGGEYLEKEVWCLTRPNEVNLAVGCNIEGERVKLPPQLRSWNSANAMYPCLGVNVAGEAGAVAYHSEKLKVDLKAQNERFSEPKEELYVGTYPKSATASVSFGEGVISQLLDKDYERNIFEARVVDSVETSGLVKEAALMWQKIYQKEFSLGNGACICRRQADERNCEPLMIPISVFTKEELPNAFCVECLCVAREIAKARRNNLYQLDMSSWPFLFLSPNNLLTMFVAVTNDKGTTSCSVITQSIETESGVRGKAKAVLECLTALYKHLEIKIKQEMNNGMDQVVEYFGDTALWAALNAIAPLDLAYTKKGQVCLENSIIISNAIQKASSCVALLENLKRDLDCNVLDKGIEKFLAHAAVQLSMVKSPMLQLPRDGSPGILVINYIFAMVDNTQINMRWTNKERNNELATLARKNLESCSPYVYRAILKTGEIGIWSDYVGRKLVERIFVGLWNVETMSLLYNDALRVIFLEDTIDLALVGQKTEQISRERFVLWKHKQQLVKKVLEIVEEIDGASGPTHIIWEELLNWQEKKVSSGVEREEVREIVANAIVLGGIATGRLSETPVLTEQISIVRKYISGETFLLWNGNAHYEVKEIPEKINLPSDLVIDCGGAGIGLRMANGEFAKLLVRSVNGGVASQVIDTTDALNETSLVNHSEHICTYYIRPSKLKQYSYHEASNVILAVLTALAKHLTMYEINDQSLTVMADEIRAYEEENGLKVFCSVDEHGNLRLRISEKSTGITTSTQLNAAPILVGASGNRVYSQHQEQTQTNVDQGVVVTSLISLRTLLGNRAKSRKTKKGLDAVASAIIAQSIAANRNVRYRATRNGCWGIVKRPKMEGGAEYEERGGELVVIDGPLAVQKGTGFRFSNHHGSEKSVLKLMINREHLIVLCGLILVENGDHADVLRMHLPLEGEAWFESYSSEMHTDEWFCCLPCNIEIGMAFNGSVQR